jgi:hypothetical protein
MLSRGSVGEVDDGVPKRLACLPVIANLHSNHLCWCTVLGRFIVQGICLEMFS